MDDDNAKEDNQPSKKESQRITSDQDFSERNKYEERGEDHVSNSESFTSGSYSGRSRIDMAAVRPEVPKPPAVKQVKPPEKKKRGRRPGRVEKRRRSPARRTAVRRAPKRKQKKERDLSVSTIFTRLSSQSGSRTPGCKFCGHRCCRRRFEYEERKRAMRRYRRRKVKRVPRRRIRSIPPPLGGSKGVQVGSRTMMLSPLFISTNAEPPDELPVESDNFCEVTPEMIYETLRRLTMWRQYVQTAAILDYMKRNYPINPDESDLLHELMHKMRIAVIVGFVTQVAEDYWCLNCALQNRTLGASHVTKFWQVYADTMKPIKRPVSNKKRELQKEKSDTNLRSLEPIYL